MYIVSQQPTTPAVSLDRIKDQLIIDKSFTLDDAMLQFMEVAERQYVSNYLQRVLPVQEVKMRVKVCNRDAVKVPTPCNRIKSITAHHGNTTSDVPISDYKVYQYEEPHLIHPIPGKEWPTADHFDIVMECGYSEVPEVFQLAILIRIADKYENRTEQVRNKMNNVTEMLHMYRIFEFQMIPGPPLIGYSGTSSQSTTTTNADELPQVDSLAEDIITLGLVAGDEFIYKAGNRDGYPDGVRVILLQDVIDEL